MNLLLDECVNSHKEFHGSKNFELSKGSTFLLSSPFPAFLRKHKDEFSKFRSQ